jgi:hypothetical protein
MSSVTKSRAKGSVLRSSETLLHHHHHHQLLLQEEEEESGLMEDEEEEDAAAAAAAVSSAPAPSTRPPAAAVHRHGKRRKLHESSEGSLFCMFASGGGTAAETGVRQRKSRGRTAGVVMMGRGGGGEEEEEANRTNKKQGSHLGKRRSIPTVHDGMVDSGTMFRRALTTSEEVDFSLVGNNDRSIRKTERKKRDGRSNKNRRSAAASSVDERESVDPLVRDDRRLLQRDESPGRRGSGTKMRGTGGHKRDSLLLEEEAKADDSSSEDNKVHANARRLRNDASSRSSQRRRQDGASQDPPATQEKRAVDLYERHVAQIEDKRKDSRASKSPLRKVKPLPPASSATDKEENLRDEELGNLKANSKDGTIKPKLSRKELASIHKELKVVSQQRQPQPERAQRQQQQRGEKTLEAVTPGKKSAVSRRIVTPETKNVETTLEEESKGDGTDQPKKPPPATEEQDGAFAYPRGRAPAAGHNWDAENGRRMKSTNMEKQDEKHPAVSQTFAREESDAGTASRPHAVVSGGSMTGVDRQATRGKHSSASLRRSQSDSSGEVQQALESPQTSYRVTNDGFLVPHVTTLNEVDGTFVRPPGRAPAGFLWDGNRGCWVPLSPPVGSAQGVLGLSTATSLVPSRVSIADATRSKCLHVACGACQNCQNPSDCGRCLNCVRRLQSSSNDEGAFMCVYRICTSPRVAQARDERSASGTLSVFCIGCGHQLPRRARFCSACGEFQQEEEGGTATGTLRHQKQTR